MLYVLILAIALTCVMCERNALRLGARTNEDTGPLDRSRLIISGERGWDLSPCDNRKRGWGSWDPCGRRRRSTEGEKERFKVRIHGDPCDFNNYDANEDGVITRDEFEAVFGDSVAAETLAEALDKSGDGHVDEGEFNEYVHHFVDGC